MIAPRVVLVTDLGVVSESRLFERIEAAAALPAPARARLAIQLRDPELSGRALLVLGRRLREATRRIGASLVVNDRLDVAASLDADGVHLGRRSVTVADARAFFALLSDEPVWVSVACHSAPDVAAAAQEGADAALLSPIFASPGKGAPLGLAALGHAREAVRAAGLAPLHLVALGGVGAASARACFEAGAGGVAAVRGDLVSTLVHDLAT